MGSTTMSRRQFVAGSVEGVIEVSARDDGHSSIPTRPGAGLTGMKERFQSLGGRVEFGLQGDAGFALHANLRCMRSFPTEMQSTSENHAECWPGLA